MQENSKCWLGGDEDEFTIRWITDDEFTGRAKEHQVDLVKG